MANQLRVDFDAWEDHASWWDNESAEAARRMATDPDTLEAARHAFGKIGSSTVGQAYADTLAARHDLGQRLAVNAQAVANHIRSNLQTYADQEHQNQQTLRT